MKQHPITIRHNRARSWIVDCSRCGRSDVAWARTKARAIDLGDVHLAYDCRRANPLLEVPHV